MSATGELTACPRADCSGSIRPSGYCSRCGLAPPASPQPKQLVDDEAPGPGERTDRSTSRQVDVDRLISRPTTQPVGLRRSRVGAGVVYVEPQKALEPEEMTSPARGAVPEDRRFCSSCSKPVGRGHNGRPGRVKGYCSSCRAPFDFSTGRARGFPSLGPGDLVAGQYQVTETLDHGGMGWIFLARDLNVSERPCVLKGLIALGDQAAAEAAEAERRYLAELSHHHNIVTIHNYVNHRDQGYIVMEYVGGRSLKEKSELHRKETGHPLPVTEVLSYLYAVLPAFGYMHRRDRVYCDFKPDNVMHVEDEVKLIDLGAVRRIDDHHASIYGTPGYQAPEVSRTGPTVASDLYTIGRTLAVLVLDWRGWKKVDEENRPVELLPDPEEHPLLVQHDCIWRFLQRACAEDPADRFADADEMAEQLYGTLCQVAATVEARTKPYRSTRWSPPHPTLDPPDWRTLPRPIVPEHPHRPNRVAGIVEGEAAIQTVERLSDDEKLSWADCVVTALAHCESRPERAMELAEGLDPTGEDAARHASVLGTARHYVRGIVALARGELDRAIAWFDAAYSAAPGEAACALAYAAALERAGDRALADDPDREVDGEAAVLYQQAAGLYDQMVVAHPAWTGAVAGLARTLDAVGRSDEAALAPLAVPESHPLRAEALILACKYLAVPAAPDETRSDGSDASTPFERIASAAVHYLDSTEPRNRPASDARLAAALCHAALVAIRNGARVPGTVARRPEIEHATEDLLAREAEDALLELADITPGQARHDLLDQAARVRPWTLR